MTIEVHLVGYGSVLHTARNCTAAAVVIEMNAQWTQSSKCSHNLLSCIYGYARRWAGHGDGLQSGFDDWRLRPGTICTSLRSIVTSLITPAALQASRDWHPFAIHCIYQDQFQHPLYFVPTPHLPSPTPQTYKHTHSETATSAEHPHTFV